MNVIFNGLDKIYKDYKNQNGNAKNADVKRLAKLFDMSFNTVINNKTISTLLIIAVLADIGTKNGIKIYKAVKEEKRKDTQINNKEGEVVYEII